MKIIPKEYTCPHSSWLPSPKITKIQGLISKKLTYLLWVSWLSKWFYSKNSIKSTIMKGTKFIWIRFFKKLAWSNRALVRTLLKFLFQCFKLSKWTELVLANFLTTLKSWFHDAVETWRGQTIVKETWNIRKEVEHPQKQLQIQTYTPRNLLEGKGKVEHIETISLHSEADLEATWGQVELRKDRTGHR